MERRTIEVRVGGQAHRVVSTAPKEELQRLAAMIDAKLAALGPRGRTQPHAVLLAAMALAHDVEVERARRDALEQRTRGLLQRLLERVDGALDGSVPPRADD